MAMTHGSGPALVVAGAGTGKTTVITRRIAWLIAEKKARPEEILALTFTDKAAREMEERVDRLVPYGFVSTNIETFHALGDKILRDNALEIGLTTDFRVMTNFQQIIFMRQLIDQAELKYYAPLGNPYRFVEGILSHFSRLKDEFISPEKYLEFVTKFKSNASSPEDNDEAERLDELARLYKSYIQTARQQGQLDFGDQIYLTLELFAKRPNIKKQYQKGFKYILVDEFQDTNLAQSKLMGQLAEGHGNLMVVGDDDQSIYRFRGAAISNILNFKKQYPKARQIVLTKNYRSSQAILDASYKLIQFNNPDRLEIANKIDKNLISNIKSYGMKPDFKAYDNLILEMDGVALKAKKLIDKGLEPRQIAILIRKNKQARPMIQALDRVGLASQQSSRESLFERPEIRVLVNFINVVNDPADSKSFYGLLNGDIFKLPLSDLAPLASAARRSHVPLEEYLINHIEKDVKITTILQQLTDFRDSASDFTAGEMIYKFINDNGYLKDLVEQADQDNLAAFMVQNLAEFFEIVREFEAISQDPNIHSFWRHLNEIHATEVDITAADSPLDTNSIQILTVHKAKGLEFEVVFMIDLADQVFPSRRVAETIKIPEGLIDISSARDWHIQEERRLFYVGLTRAKRQLHLSASYDHGGKRLRKISPFILEMFDQFQPIKPTIKSGLIDKIEAFAKGKTPLPNITDQLYRDGWLHLTPHQIEDYLNDPKEFWFWHILNVPRGPFHSLVYGSAVHRAIEYYYRTKLAGQAVTTKQCYEVFEKAWVSEGFVSRSHEAARFARGKDVLKQFIKSEEKKQDWPIAVEQEFSFNLDKLKVRINGRYDAVYKRGQEIEIRDFKTSNVTDQNDANNRLRKNIQMPIYALAWEKTGEQAVSFVSLNFIENDILAITDKIDHAKIIEKIELVAEGIKNQNFRSSGRSKINFDRLL